MNPKLFAAAAGWLLSVTSLLAVPNFSSTTPLQSTFDGITVGGASSVNVPSDWLANDGIWATLGVSGSEATTVVLLDAPPGQLSAFGIYDTTAPNRRVRLFQSGTPAGQERVFVITANGQVFVDLQNTGVVFAGNRFGFYYSYGTATFFSQDNLNADALDHMVAYAGNGSDQIIVGSNPQETWGPDHYALAFENGSAANGGDYADFAVLVDSIQGVPDGGTSILLLGISLVTLAAYRRSQSRA